MPQVSVRVLKHVELVLPLERDVDPWLAGMKIEMPRAEAIAAAGGDRPRVGQDPVIEPEQFQRARVLGPAARGVIAARDENGKPVVGRAAYLVRENAEVEIARLLDFLANAAVAVDPVHGQRAGVVVCGQCVAPGRIDTDMKRAMRQRLRRTMQRQHTRFLIDPVCG
jgi:hypothetical protein